MNLSILRWTNWDRTGLVRGGVLSGIGLRSLASRWRFIPPYLLVMMRGRRSAGSANSDLGSFSRPCICSAS